MGTPGLYLDPPSRACASANPRHLPRSRRPLPRARRPSPRLHPPPGSAALHPGLTLRCRPRFRIRRDLARPLSRGDGEARSDRGCSARRRAGLGGVGRLAARAGDDPRRGDREHHAKPPAGPDPVGGRDPVRRALLSEPRPGLARLARQSGALDRAIPMVYTLDDQLLRYQLEGYIGTHRIRSDLAGPRRLALRIESGAGARTARGAAALCASPASCSSPTMRSQSRPALLEALAVRARRPAGAGRDASSYGSDPTPSSIRSLPNTTSSCPKRRSPRRPLADREASRLLVFSRDRGELVEPARDHRVARPA